jgi:hypothetical protein
MSQKTPATRQSGSENPQGRPRKNLTEGGVHLLLWPTFAFSLKKSSRLANLWRAVPNRRDYFIRLACVAALPPDSEDTRDPLFRCYSIAPELTCQALPLLRARFSEISREQYLAATRNPASKLSQKEVSMRADMRKALGDFVAQTAV